MVRGAAVGALVELKTQEAVVALRQAIGIGQSTDVVELQNLRTEQLRAAFDSFDMDGDGVVSKEQLKNYLQNLVTSLSPDVMENKLRNPSRGKLQCLRTPWACRSVECMPS